MVLLEGGGAATELRERVQVAYATVLRPCYALSGTDIAYRGRTKGVYCVLRVCYALSGTDVACAAPYRAAPSLRTPCARCFIRRTLRTPPTCVRIHDSWRISGPGSGEREGGAGGGEEEERRASGGVGEGVGGEEEGGGGEEEGGGGGERERAHARGGVSEWLRGVWRWRSGYATRGTDVVAAQTGGGGEGERGGAGGREGGQGGDCAAAGHNRRICSAHA
eukprot:3284720-Rhodomonas_salina.1